MLKEEKIIINNELINYISLKETFESIIKTNLNNLIPTTNPIVKSNENFNEEINLEKNVLLNNSNQEKYSRNRVNNNINDIQEINFNINEISDLNFNNNNISLYKYELYNLDPNKLSNEICNDIFDLINYKLISKESFNNLGKSISLEKNNSIKMLGKGKSQKINDRYNSFNPQTFSCDSPIIKRTKSNILVNNNTIMAEFKNEIQNLIKNEIKQLINDVNENKISINNINEILSNVIINILNEKGYKLNKKNLMIYISCVLKKEFFEYQISSKIKFLNKDYKTIKKLKKKIYDKLQDQLTKLNSKIESINNTIILQENKLKLLNNNIDNKKNKVDKSEIINLNGNINLSLEEQNYIQLCRKANSFINEKNEIEKEIEMIENDKKLEKYQGELKINNMKNELNDLNKQIISKEKEISQSKKKYEENLITINKEIENKLLSIKENLISYKIDCANNSKQNEYNEFIERINASIKNNYYKTLFNLEKFYIKNKKPEFNTNIENMKSNDNILKTNKSFNFKSYRNTNVKNMKLFSYGNGFFSPVNDKNKNNLFNIKNKENNEQSSSKNNIFQNRIKNNYINIFDSYNNLNNYFFQFQTPSTMVSLDKRNNKIETNNVINQIKNNIEQTNVSSSSLFSSSNKLSSSKKKVLSRSNNKIKPKNLIYNLRYLSTDKKYMQNENRMNNINEFKLIQNNTINIYKNGISNITKENNEKNILKNFSHNKLKSKSKSNFISKCNTNLNFHQINIINKKIFCYFRIKEKTEKEDNPSLKNISQKNLCESPYNFLKSNIYIDQPNKKIKIYPSNQLEPIEINSDKIENKKLNKNDNKFFSFELLLKNEKIFEFLFTSCEEYKIANDYIGSLIKDKKESLYEFFNFRKFEYPK